MGAPPLIGLDTVIATIRPTAQQDCLTVSRQLV